MLTTPRGRGRPPGAKNKRPSAIAIGSSLAAKGIDLAERYLKIADDPEVAAETRLKALDSLAKYSQLVPTVQDAESDTPDLPADTDISDDDITQALS